MKLFMSIVLQSVVMLESKICIDITLSFLK